MILYLMKVKICTVKEGTGTGMLGMAFQSASLSDSFFSKYEKRETFIKTRLGSVKRKLKKLFSHS